MAKKLSPWMEFFEFMERIFRLESPRRILIDKSRYRFPIRNSRKPDRVEYVIDHGEGKVDWGTIFLRLFNERFETELKEVKLNHRLVAILFDRYRYGIADFIHKYAKYLRTIYKARGLDIDLDLHNGIRIIAFHPYEEYMKHRLLRRLG